MPHDNHATYWATDSIWWKTHYSMTRIFVRQKFEASRTISWPSALFNGEDTIPFIHVLYGDRGSVKWCKAVYCDQWSTKLVVTGVSVAPTNHESKEVIRVQPTKNLFWEVWHKIVIHEKSKQTGRNCDWKDVRCWSQPLTFVLTKKRCESDSLQHFLIILLLRRNKMCTNWRRLAIR